MTTSKSIRKYPSSQNVPIPQSGANVPKVERCCCEELDKLSPWQQDIVLQRLKAKYVRGSDANAK